MGLGLCVIIYKTGWGACPWLCHWTLAGTRTDTGIVLTVPYVLGYAQALLMQCFKALGMDIEDTN